MSNFQVDEHFTSVELWSLIAVSFRPICNQKIKVIFYPLQKLPVIDYSLFLPTTK